jgi:uncharacterized protein YxjI
MSISNTMTDPPQSQPTRYLIQEKHLSLDNRFIITDDSGVVRYKVNSTFFAMGDKLLISDADGKELIRIRQENLHLHLTYKIFGIRSDGSEYQLGSIKRTGAPWQHKLEISSGDGEYIMKRTGGASSRKFTITKGDMVIATTTKDVSPTKSLYWVNIIDHNEEDHAFLLSVVIVLSCAQRLPGNPIIPHSNETEE